MKLQSGEGSTLHYAANWDVDTASITTQVEGVTALSGFEMSLETLSAILLESGATLTAPGNLTFGDVEVGILADGDTDQYATLHGLALAKTPLSILGHFSTGKGVDVEANVFITKVSQVTESGALNAYTITLSVSGIPDFKHAS
ncbi:hypothetical protein [Moritella viscosa]|uniref:Tryptophan synthase alpha chain n=1 Tax=Moritella viscosa TaxID=80854 RepID=A0A1L0AKT3_9GAMM|nr:hypothetical protein [Moritella viscosa]SGZ16453.1 Tryptophan synthase alpha chain [Moritella viscosa]SHO02328.1 Tryptophan synthase alpha chain [Moritella viscosa]SHO02456.1 Tryptophan synthase alpha chain [Moritella viscosa]SHO07171.1 Tryptophan synthase alpha chain [Moritella viscosa]SHO17776.1 Tryptophan synthase alpha chain [Moritella viscosa]